MLEIKNLSYVIDENGKKKTILENINFSVNENQNLVITGHNGSGKSTLLKLIMGIDKPTTGSIIFDGNDITNLDITQRAKLGIAFAFQTPVCFKGLTVKKLLQIASEKSEKDIDSFCQILSKLGMCARDYIDREVSNKLSGGEQKRIEIASVLARNAKLNLFDEPEAGIDIWSFDNLINIFEHTNGINIIVSHQKKLIEKASEIILLDSGKIVEFGSPDKMMPKIEDRGYCEKLRRENGQN